MKKLIEKAIFTLIALLVISLASCDNSSTDDNSSSNTNSYTVSLSEDTENERAVIAEMNIARTDPKSYVTTRLIPMRTNYAGSSTTYMAALEECITLMNSMTPVGSLSYGSGLYKAAKEWVDVQGRGTSSSDIGHDSNLINRVSAHCNYTSMGENIAYGYYTARDIVIALLVDDEVPDRGHRTNMLNGSYTHAGVSIGSHGYYRVMCCIDYAGGYSNK